jgi:hypothetical protein
VIVSVDPRHSNVDQASCPDDPAARNNVSKTRLPGCKSAAGVKRGNVLIGTEEQFNDDCETDGRIVISDLTDSWGGAKATASTPERPYRMPALSTWHPTDGAPDTTAATDDCSAHYFSLQDGVLASAWYFRVQATDPATNPSSVVWDVRWHRGYAYVIDNERGIEVLRLLRGGTGHAAEMATVRALAARPDPYAPVPVDDGRFNCPLFVDSPAAVAAKGTAG